jgi:hypothetical protein
LPTRKTRINRTPKAAAPSGIRRYTSTLTTTYVANAH